MKTASDRFPRSGTMNERKQITAISAQVSPVRSKKPGSTPM